MVFLKSSICSQQFVFSVSATDGLKANIVSEDNLIDMNGH